MPRPFLPALAVLASLLTACHPAPPANDQPPAPRANGLRPALQAPLQRARAVQGEVDAAAARQAARLEQAER